MSREALALWAEAARDLEEVRTSLPAPMHVLMAEAIDLAQFCRDFWQPIVEGPSVRPGLSEADSVLSEHTAGDLLVLEEALHTAHTEYLLTLPPIQSGMRARAESVLSELHSAIEWLLSDRHDEYGEELSRLHEAHAALPDHVDVLAIQIADYAALASRLRLRLASVSGFDMSLVDDAHHLVRELRQLGGAVSLSAETAPALELRNRMATLLTNRMALVRSAARVVFRDCSSIAQRAASTFELRRQTSSRQQAAGCESLGERVMPTMMS